MEIIRSKENQLIKHVAKLISEKKERNSQRLFVLEGLRLCEDAAACGICFEEVLFTPEFVEKFSVAAKKIMAASHHFACIDQPLAERISDTCTPQGVFGVCKMLDKAFSEITIDHDGFYVALENLRDPGNMGTIIRAAEALGALGLIVSPQCADLFSPKAVRATMGSLLRLPVYQAGDFIQALQNLNSAGYTSYAAVLRDADCYAGGFSVPARSVLVIGNEGDGLTQECVACCTHRVTICMAGNAESLNAASAASILMWEFSKAQK